MKAGVLSDTHLADPAGCQRLAEGLMATCFADVDIILHAGDVGHPDLLFHFAPLDVLAVGGNTDIPHPELPVGRLFSIDGVQIALSHGWGSPAGLEQRLCSHFKDDRPDVIIFGHSHIPVCRKHGSLLLFNPGSPTQPRSSAGPTVGILEFDNGQATGGILSCRGLFDEDYS